MDEPVIDRAVYAELRDTTGAKFLGELVGAGDPPVQRGQDAHAQRVREGLRQLLGDSLGGRSSLSQWMVSF